MAHITLANSTDISHWSDRIVSRSEVPRLLRRLIHATCQDVQKLGFPADEGVQLGGWDGIVHSASGNAYIPAGVSAWETGANLDVKGKADDDYEKRSQNPLDVLPDEATFVFITPRRWGGKDDWVRTHNTDGIWHEVRAYDAEDLAQWLEQAPAVHIWLSELIGKRSPGIRSLDDFWMTWVNETRPPLPPALVVGGRTRERNQVLSWLQSNPSPLSLAGDSVSEVIAFFASVLQELEAEERTRILSRAVVVESAEDWRYLGPSTTPLVLIPNFADPEGVGRVVLQGHHVFAALDRAGAGGATVLPRLVRAVAEQALLEAGVKSERAGELATLARRSLSSLRRTIAVAPGLLAPFWARAEVARELIAPLLAGTWQEHVEGDRAALANLAGMRYEELQPVLSRKINEPGPALRRTADIWMIAGRADTWQRLASYLTEDDLKHFEGVVLGVLGEIDPALDLPLHQRYMANMLGKSRSYSSHLRNGLAETMAMMAALNPNNFIGLNFSGEDFAGRMVRSLLERARGRAELWASLSNQLPMLAEAAPNVFLDAVSEGLSGETPVLVALFQDKEHSMFGSSPHTGLLWALETLAWSSEHFGQAVLSLVRLARLDPGGKMGNRPASSLRDIFLCWYPHTTASLTQRLNAIDAMRKREAEVSWRLMMQLLPRMHSSVSPTHKPQWRDWMPEDEGVLISEYIEATDGILSRLLSDVGANVDRLSDLIEATGELSALQREKFLGYLDTLNKDLFPSEERSKIQTDLRSVIGRHREFSDAEWSMPRADTDRLEQIYDRFWPEDLIVKFRWLFKYWVPVPGLRHADWEQREQSVKELRVKAVQEIYQSHSWAGLLELAAQSENAYSIGQLLLQIKLIPESEEKFLRELISSENAGHRMLAQGFIMASVSVGGEQWSEARLADMRHWQAEQIANFLLCLPFAPVLLDKLDAASEDVKQFFWKGLRSACLFDDNVQTERVITALLDFDRSDLALEVVERVPEGQSNFLTPEHIADVLEACVQSPSISTFGITSIMYSSAELLDRLEKSDLPKERLARLEWQYLPLHEHHRQPRLLHHELSRDPEFFIEVLNQAYPSPMKGAEEENNEVNTEAAARVRMAHVLLSSWRLIPGRQEDTIDTKVLEQWVNNVRELASANDQLAIADDTFGRVFASSPVDSDGSWPHIAIRDLIENLASPEVEDAWRCQIVNNRGATSRGLTDGGDQERALADQYEGYAFQIGDFWPRTAAVLRHLVQDYRRYAAHHDAQADLTQDFWK